MKNRLIVSFHESSLTLALLNGEKEFHSEKIFLRETPEEMVKGKILSLLNGKKRTPTLLLLPRSDVLQKELVLQKGGNLKASLESRLEEILPYSPREMALGLSEGLLFAIPEKHLKEKLLFLKRLGIEPHEIVTEDQPLLWLLLERKEKEALLLDRNEDRILALSLHSGKLSFSRSFSLKESPDFLNETSLALLEKGEKPEKVLLTGAWDPETSSLVFRHFNLPGEGLQTDIFQAARLFGKYPLTSLLPREEKLRRRAHEKKRLYREALLSFLLFLGVVCLAFLSHLNALEREGEKLEKRLLEITPQVEEVKEMSRSLNLVSDARSSKEKALELLKALAQKLPSSIRLRELRIEGKDFLFKGESPSHSLLSETVGAFSEMTDFLKETKLGETRARKRLNEDYFEFEVTGQWQT